MESPADWRGCVLLWRIWAFVIWNYKHNSLSNALAIDYYPASVFILRFRPVTTYKDLLDSDQDILSNTLEFRLIA